MRKINTKMSRILNFFPGPIATSWLTTKTVMKNWSFLPFFQVFIQRMVELYCQHLFISEFRWWINKKVKNMNISFLWLHMRPCLTELLYWNSLSDLGIFLYIEHSISPNICFMIAYVWTLPIFETLRWRKIDFFNWQGPCQKSYAELEFRRPDFPGWQGAE